MIGGWSEGMVRDRIGERLAEAEEGRLARLARPKPTPRARIARGLFRLAVALQRDETWRAVWERLEAPRHP